MTIGLKREIMRQFIGGKEIRAIWIDVSDAYHEFEIHQVVREFCSGKFTLERKRFDALEKKIEEKERRDG